MFKEATVGEATYGMHNSGATFHTKNALTRSIFEQEKCFFFLNGSEFRQKLIGTIIRVLVRHLCA